MAIRFRKTFYCVLLLCFESDNVGFVYNENLFLIFYPFLCPNLLDSRFQSTAAATPTLPFVPADPTPEEIIRAADAYFASQVGSNDSTFLGGLREQISKYGVYPFVGLGGFALVSKEIIMLNTEFLVLSNFLLLGSIAYIQFSGKVGEFVQNERVKVVKDIQNNIQFRQDVAVAQLDMCKAATNAPKVVTEIYDAFLEANAAAAKARDLKARAAFREQIMQRLTSLKQQEDEATEQKREAVRSETLASVLEAVKSQKVKSAVLDEAIAMVGAREDKTGTFAAINSLLQDTVKKAQSAKKL